MPKLGFGVAADIAKAAASYPSVLAFQSVAGILDLRSLWQAVRARPLPQGGLSGLTATLLGAGTNGRRAHHHTFTQKR